MLGRVNELRVVLFAHIQINPTFGYPLMPITTDIELIQGRLEQLSSVASLLAFRS